MDFLAVCLVRAIVDDQSVVVVGLLSDDAEEGSVSWEGGGLALIPIASSRQLGRLIWSVGGGWAVRRADCARFACVN